MKGYWNKYDDNFTEPGTEYLISLAMFNEHGRSAKFIVKASTLGKKKCYN